MVGLLRRERPTVRRGLTGGSRVPGQAGNDFGREATGQEPGEMPTAALDRILCAPVASCEFVKARGQFPTEQAAFKCVYPAVMSLDRTGRARQRWSNRWKPALNAFTVAFPDRIVTTTN